MLLYSAAFNKEEWRFMLKSHRFALSLILSPAISVMRKCSCCSVRTVLQVEVALDAPSKASQRGTSVQNSANNAPKIPKKRPYGTSFLKLMSGLFHTLWIWQSNLMFVIWWLLVIACRSKCSLPGHGWSHDFAPVPLWWALQVSTLGSKGFFSPCP